MMITSTATLRNVEGALGHGISPLSSFHSYRNLEFQFRLDLLILSMDCLIGAYTNRLGVPGLICTGRTLSAK